jgi:aspartokinase-like uncharacterized kinase
LRPIVVKLGGSLAESGRLTAILKIVAGTRAPVAIVPGGGAFAEAVRCAQADLGFSDAAAHRMALLAMHQTGLMLAALNRRLAPVETLAGIEREILCGRIPVWLPLKLTERDRRVPADWSATSDALAARLAERLGRAPVVLVKSCRIAKDAAIAALVRAGIVDPMFAEIVDRARLPWRVLGAGEEGELAAMLDGGGPTRPSLRRSRRDACRRRAPARAIARRR